MSGPSEQARQIFLEAIEKHTPEEWPAFLAQACATDAVLRAAVEDLLRAHAEMGSFHEEPRIRTEGTVDEPAQERPGTILGPYKLLEQIGAGGFGAVFMAEQRQPVRRQVALKVLKPGMDTAQVVARFEAERQALAVMDHPNIAHVFDGGETPTGRPYFVMELVKGIPITKYCDEQQLSPRERLALFVPVCEAVQHAHQKGIIHRDIKPSNVLVASYDGRPVPKVIDFGVAKALGQQLTERTLVTNFGGIIGTLEYMSPEQAEFNALNIDTRADIYGLGVLLYELLTGTTPLTKQRVKEAALTEVLRLIREEEPPAPSTRLSGSKDSLASISAQRKLEPSRLTKEIRGELDWIVMKCLEKERNRRYDTANGIARDIQRFLNDEPLEAGPPSAVYRLRKYARKYKKTLAAVAAFALLLLAATAISIGLASWALRERGRAEDQQQVAEANEKAAQASEKEAKNRADETRAVLDFVENKVFAAARPKGQQGGLGREVTLRQAMESALERVDGSFTDQPLVEARLRMTIGISFWYLGEPKSAETQFLRALELRRNQLGLDHPDTLFSMQNLANSYADLGRHAEALKLRQETLALMKTKLGPDHPLTLSGINNLANSHYTLGQHTEALRLREELLQLRRATLGIDHRETLAATNNVANSYDALGRYADSLKLREETLAFAKSNLGPDHPETLFYLNNLATSYYFLRRYAEALKLYEETLERRQVQLGPYHADTLRTMMNLGSTKAALGKHEEALKLREETLMLMKAHLGADYPDTLMCADNLAGTYAHLGRYADALKIQKETLPLLKVRFGPAHPTTLLARANLGNSLEALGQHAEALNLREDTLQSYKATLGPDHPATLKGMWAVADSLVTVDRGEEAVPMIDDCLRRAIGKVVHPELLPGVMKLRLKVFQKKKETAGCLETAERWEELKRADAASLYQAARFRAVCAAVIAEAKGQDPEAVLLAGNQAEMAMAWLSKAVAAGYKDVAQIKKEEDLAALGDRPDFQRLVTELEAKAKVQP